MAIYRGSGGAGDATGDATNASVLAVAAAAEAQASATSAASSATNAASSASAASTSETDAGNSATAAATSATDAAASASTASTQATNASNSATAAASSASAASSSASNASSSASAASTSATNAASSASSASTSASSASTSATNAANSASAASTSATNAANSATSASSSATEAATYVANQTGNSGKFLTTNGTSVSWGTPTTIISDGSLTPAKLSTGAPSWDSSGNITSIGNITLNNGNADGAQLQLSSSGYSAWNLDNYSGRLRAYYNTTEQFSITSAGLFQFNSGYGSVATAYGCRAWVNFNGTGTVAIRASGNVSSITDNSTGNYTVNFTTAMPDANYSFVFGGVDNNWGNKIALDSGNTPTTTALRILTFTGAGSTNNVVDLSYVCVSVFR